MKYEVLYNSIQQLVPMPLEEYEQVAQQFIVRDLAPGDYLLRKGEICRNGIFVLDGCLSYYALDNKGGQQVMDIGTAGWWMADAESFFEGTPSPYFIKALAPATVLITTREKMLNAFQQSHRYLQYHYFALLQYRHRTDRLLAGALHHTAEEKYLELMQVRPELFQLAPLQDIASFLGLTPQSLSRVRSQLAGKQNMR